MSSVIETVAITAAAVCAGATGGVYLAFTSMVMPALTSRSASEAIGVMQRINVQAMRPPFMFFFFGGALASAVAGVTTAASETPSVLRLVGVALSLASFGVTVAVNVPLNNSLARIPLGLGTGNGPGQADSGAWRAFERPWTRATTVRAALALGGTAALAGSLAE